MRRLIKGEIIMVNKKSWEEFKDSGLLWWINTLLHTFGYAIVYNYDENGNIKQELYFINGNRHREDGAAIIQYDINRNIINEKYYYNGKELDLLQWMVIQGLRME